MLPCIARLRWRPQFFHGAGASVAVDQKVYNFGRLLDDRYVRFKNQIAVRIFNTASLRWTTLPPVATTRGERPPEVPCSRFQHTAVLIGGIVYIWGGRDYLRVCSNALYAFDVGAHRWLSTEVSGSVPEASYDHAACALGTDMYVHGGWNAAGPTDHIYRLDTKTMVWTLRGHRPPVKASHSASIIGTEMFVFGGIGYQYSIGAYSAGYRHVFVFDTENSPNSSSYVTSTRHPRERGGHSAFVYNGELYIFGGKIWWSTYYFDDDNDDDDEDRLWKFNPQTRSWAQVKLEVSEPFRIYHGCCCVVGDRVVIFGGYKGDYIPNRDLYILDFSPSLKTRCQLSVIQHGLNQSQLPYNVRSELAAMKKTNLPRRNRAFRDASGPSGTQADLPNCKRKCKQ